VITLGFYLKQFGSYGANVNKLSVYPWFSSKHNMGMAINRDTWLMIKNCSQVGKYIDYDVHVELCTRFELFCTYDDYNWDWSLMNVNMQCLTASNRLYVIYPMAPRVFHIDDCGVNYHKCDSNSSSSVGKLKEMLTHVSDRLFPSSMHVSVIIQDIII
jgi:alpha-1,6-mannosyl-glycoprotein beta-1,2-N-acetylglucosaminyltransferase